MTECRCVSLWWQCKSYKFFFLVYSYSHEAYLDYGGVHFDLFPAAVRARAARCKLPSAIRPGLSHEGSEKRNDKREDK
jgi:hypothetical protein